MAGTLALALSLVLLLLLLPAALRLRLREYVPPAATNVVNYASVVGVADDKEHRHPIVLVPGGSCGELEARLTDAYRPSSPRCGAMKGRGWFGLWQNVSDLPVRHYVACFMDQMRLVYDPAADDYRNVPGVETRVPNFGDATGFHKNPLHPDWCLNSLRKELERIGYREGDTLFGAPYDIRYVPPIPGQPSQVFSRYFRQLTALVENAAAAASDKSKSKKVILFGHSFGGRVALEFVRSTPAEWRAKYVKHLVLVSPLPAAGSVYPVKNFVSGNTWFYIPTTTPLSVRPLWRSFEVAVASFPTAAVFGGRRPVVVTRRRNYSAHDMADLIADVGAARAVEPFTRRELPRSRYFRAPMVPVTCINGVGSPTPEQLVYWDADFDREPDTVVYGDGDETVNLVSMLAFDEEMRRHTGQRNRYKSIMLPGATHTTLLTEEWSLKRVIQEINRANK